MGLLSLNCHEKETALFEHVVVSGKPVFSVFMSACLLKEIFMFLF